MIVAARLTCLASEYGILSLVTYSMEGLGDANVGRNGTYIISACAFTLVCFTEL